MARVACAVSPDRNSARDTCPRVKDAAARQRLWPPGARPGTHVAHVARPQAGGVLAGVRRQRLARGAVDGSLWRRRGAQPGQTRSAPSAGAPGALRAAGATQRRVPNPRRASQRRRGAQRSAQRTRRVQQETARRCLGRPRTSAAVKYPSPVCVTRGSRSSSHARKAAKLAPSASKSPCQRWCCATRCASAGDRNGASSPAAQPEHSGEPPPRSIKRKQPRRAKLSWTSPACVLATWERS
jgi:hypothetical protein